MMINLWLLVHREVKTHLLDRRVISILILTTVLLYPGLIIGGTYFQQQQVTNAEFHVPRLSVEGDFHTLSQIITPPTIKIVATSNAIKLLKKGELEGVLHIVKLANGQYQFSYQYNNMDVRSLAGLNKITTWIEQLKTTLVQDTLESHHINNDLLTPLIFQVKTISTEQTPNPLMDALPYFIVVGIIVGAMAVGVDITAGEKERATLISLLVSRNTRWQIAIGKMITTSVFGVIASVLSLVGMLFAFMISARILNQNTNPLIDGKTMVLLIIELLPLVFFISTIITLIGVYSKSVKEANSFIMPLNMTIIFAGLIGSTIDKDHSSSIFIPVLNNVLAIKQILQHNIDMLFITQTIVISLIYTCIVMYVCVRFFKSEKVIFR